MPTSDNLGNQSQKHGFIFENEIKKKVFDLHILDINNTNKYDIPKHINKFNKNENCSIKTTKNNTICCADILRFYNSECTIIVIKYKQIKDEKVIEKIYEINYNDKCHKLLFGDLPRDVIEEYVKNVNSIPKKTGSKDAKKIFHYLNEKKKIEDSYTHIIKINPKVDTKQSRVQCSITKFEETLKDFITYKSSPDKPNILREKEIDARIVSCERERIKKTK